MPLKALALENVNLKVTKIEIVYNTCKLENMKRLDFDKPQICTIYPKNNSSRIMLENTEIPLDELMTKKGIAKLLPALVSTYISMNTLKIYGMQEDKVLHHTFNYVVSKITARPVKTVITVSIAKEIGNDYLLGKGTPDWNDVLANLLGALQSKLVESPVKTVNDNSKSSNNNI